MKPLRIAFYGNFGAGNLGNECTLQAVIQAVRLRLPDAQLLCICTEPQDVQSRHGVAAVRATARASGWSWKAMANEAAATGATAATRGAIASTGNAIRSGRLSRLFARAARLVFQRLPTEALHWLKSFRTTTGTDILIVPGTQIVSDYLCGPYSWPYDIFKWSLVAKLRRAKLVFLSVGVGPINHPLSRWFIRRSLKWAAYRSYRDEASRQYAESIGISTSPDSVFPDLAFGLTGREWPRLGARDGHRRVIGLGLKDYSGPADGEGRNGYRAYLDAMATFVAWLCRNDYTVRLLIGDVQFDTQVRQEFIEMLRSRGTELERSLVFAESPLTVEQLIGQLADTDAIVSPRFHNLVLALELDKPVIALSDHAKLDSLLSGLGLPQYCVPLDQLQTDDLINRFQQMMGEANRLQPYIRDKVGSYREALDAQYAMVLAAPIPGMV